MFQCKICHKQISQVAIDNGDECERPDCAMRFSIRKSLWVIRDRDTHNYWNGFGYTDELKEAALYAYPAPSPDELDWLPFAADILELRLVERDLE